MNPASRLARRYHWHSATVRDFTCEPHAAIVGEPAGVITNLVDRRAHPAREAMLTVARTDPERTVGEARKLVMPGITTYGQDVDLKRLGAVLAVAHQRDLHDFAVLLLVEKLGRRTLQSLALVAEVVHGAPTHFSDPARFSFAHGGKDGHPFPVPLTIYDESIAILRRGLDAAKLGDRDKLDGMRARLERSSGPSAIDTILRPTLCRSATGTRHLRFSRRPNGFRRSPLSLACGQGTAVSFRALAFSARRAELLRGTADADSHAGLSISPGGRTVVKLKHIISAGGFAVAAALFPTAQPLAQTPQTQTPQTQSPTTQIS